MCLLHDFVGVLVSSVRFGLPSHWVKVSTDPQIALGPGVWGCTALWLLLVYLQFQQFCNSGDATADKQEAAAFLANVLKETGGYGAFKEVSPVGTYCTWYMPNTQHQRSFALLLPPPLHICLHPHCKSWSGSFYFETVRLGTIEALLEPNALPSPPPGPFQSCLLHSSVNGQQRKGLSCKQNLLRSGPSTVKQNPKCVGRRSSPRPFKLVSNRADPSC